MSTTHRRYDVFLSFRGDDTRRNFISHFNRELDQSSIRTFKDDTDLESGGRISPELNRAIEKSKFAVVVVSVNYTASTWCLKELVKIMDLVKEGLIEVIPIFYGVEPSHLRFAKGVVAEHFEKHKGRYNPEEVLSWKQALINLAEISGYCSCKWEEEWEMVNHITERISKKLMIAKPRRSGSKLVEIDRHMKAIRRKLDLNSNKSVKVFGIWARGSDCRSALAKFVYDDISQDFESHCFIESVKKISQDRHLSRLREEVLKKIQGEYGKVLLVADDATELKQIDALADDFNNFGPGSIVIITTQNKQLLKSANINLVYEIEFLRFQRVRKLFRQFALREKFLLRL